MAVSQRGGCRATVIAVHAKQQRWAETCILYKLQVFVEGQVTQSKIEARNAARLDLSRSSRAEGHLQVQQAKPVEVGSLNRGAPMIIALKMVQMVPRRLRALLERGGEDKPRYMSRYGMGWATNGSIRWGSALKTWPVAP